MVTGLGTPVANLLVPDLIAYQGTSPTNATANAAGGSGSGAAGALATSNAVYNAFNAVIVARGDQGAVPASDRSVLLASSPSVPLAPRVDLAATAVDRAPVTASNSSGLGLSLTGGSSTNAGSQETSTRPATATTGAFNGTIPEVGPAFFAPALSEGAVIDVTTPPAMCTAPIWVGEGGTDLLLGGDGEDLVLGDGRDLLVGGFGPQRFAQGSDSGTTPPTAASSVSGSAAASTDAFFASVSQDAVLLDIGWLFGGNNVTDPGTDIGDAGN